jgi:hypothetical protein
MRIASPVLTTPRFAPVWSITWTDLTVGDPGVDAALVLRRGWHRPISEWFAQDCSN